MSSLPGGGCFSKGLNNQATRRLLENLQESEIMNKIDFTVLGVGGEYNASILYFDSFDRR